MAAVEEKKPVRRSGVALSEYLTKRLESLKAERLVFDTLWDELARYILPRKADTILRKNTEVNAPSSQNDDVLYDTTAVFANATLANGMLSYMTPQQGRWFALGAPEHLKDNDTALAWYSKCSAIMAKLLATSNFYTEIHESYFDDGAFGTSCIIEATGKSSFFNFQKLDVGTFWIDEDEDGNVDTIFREITLTARQCAAKFGEKNLGPKMAKAYEEFCKEGKDNSRFTIGHAIYPREEGEISYGKKDGQNMPFASVYWFAGDKTTLSNSGFNEKNFFPSRFLKWSGYKYGSCPGVQALPEARQLNFLTKVLDALAEIAAHPRILYPDHLDPDDMDLRAGGCTPFDPEQPNAMPKEWMTSGRYDVGLDREKRKQAMIERIFFVDMFNMFANQDKQMTAREVAERAAERLVQFSPAFGRKNAEVLTPILKRCFGRALRAGMFPPPPNDVVMKDQTGAFIPDPDIAYNSKIALALSAQETNDAMRTLESITPIAGVAPEIMDNFDFDAFARGTARNNGMPEDYVRPEDAIKDMRDSRAKAQAEAQQQQQQLMQSQALANAGKVKSDSPVAQAITQAQQ